MAAPTITRTAIVDDDGTLTTGTIINNAWKTEFYDQIDAVVGGVVQTTTLTGTQNDFALTAKAVLLRCNNATLLTLTGLAAGFDGQRVTIESVGAGQVDLSHQGAGSTAANRLINFATSAATSLAAGSGTAIIMYDATTARWRLVAHEQGAWIAVTYAAGNFTGSAGTWTVDAGDQTTFAYNLKGRTLNLSLFLVTTSTTTPGTQLRVALPAGFTCAKAMIGTYHYADNSTQGVGLWESVPAATVINFYTLTLAAWAAAANTTAIRATFAFEVT